MSSAKMTRIAVLGMLATVQGLFTQSKTPQSILPLFNDYVRLASDDELNQKEAQNYFKDIRTKLAGIGKEQLGTQEYDSQVVGLRAVFPPEGAFYAKLSHPPTAFRQGDNHHILGLTISGDILQSPFFWWQPVTIPHIIQLQNVWQDAQLALAASGIPCKLGAYSNI